MDKICSTMMQLLQQGKFREAAQFGELSFVENFSLKVNSSYIALLAASHLANGAFPAARLAVVRGTAELGANDKSLDFLSRILDARNRGKYSDAVGALKSGPEDVRGIFQDILVCEVAATTAATYSPPSTSIVTEVTGVSLEEVKASLSRMGKAFGVGIEGANFVRITAEVSAKQAANKTDVASVKMVTEAALMTAQPVDRYWN